MATKTNKPESSTTPSQPRESAPPYDAREDAIKRNMQRRLGTSGGSAVGVAVGNGATSHAVTFARREFDANYGVSITPSWSTTVRIAPADKSTTGFTVRFGTAAGATDFIDWLVYRAG
jgi:hypothetical protein